MTDIALDSTNDLLIEDGIFNLLTTQETVVRQKLLNRLRSFTRTLFTDVNYGIRQEVAFGKNTQAALTQNIKTIISTTAGVVRLVSFDSTVGVDRVYRADFTYEVTTGAIEGLTIPIAATPAPTPPTSTGVWQDGLFTFSGIWDNTQIWGT